MNTLARTALQLLGRATHARYLRRERALAAAHKPLSILLSAQAPSEPRIREGFAGLPHRLRFERFDTADLEGFDLIVPMSLDDAQLLRRQSAFTRARTAPLPSEACAALCRDKTRLNEALILGGFSGHIPAMGDHVRPPFIVRAIGAGSGGARLLVRDRAAMERLTETVQPPGTFRQHAVAGSVEYATHFAMREGRIERALTVRQHHEAALFIDGEPSLPPPICTLGDCPDLATLTAMLNRIDYDGVGCARYKMDSGVLKLFEIDARIDARLGSLLFSFVRSMLPPGRSRRSAFMPWSWIDTATEESSLSAF
jgi:hypothetical protein